MKSEELIKEMNRINLEACIVGSWLYQFKKGADENCMLFLSSVLTEVCPDMCSDQPCEKECLNKLKSLQDDYVGLCLQVMISPQIAEGNSKFIVSLFVLLLDKSYAFLTRIQTERFVYETAKMVFSIEDKMSCETFSCFANHLRSFLLAERFCQVQQ